MHFGIVTVLFFKVATTAVRIPFVRDATFVPISNVRSLTLTHRTCDQCLCESNSSHVILNCFPNDTCQLFTTIPRTYTLQSALNAMVFFPQRILPNASESCASDTDFLLSRLNVAIPTYANVSGPRCILLDDHGYLVTVSTTARSIIRFYANNLTQIDDPTSPISDDEPSTLAHYNGAYYVGFLDYILVVDSSVMTQLHKISASGLYGTRDMMFLSNGRMMIVASCYNNQLFFFNQSSAGSTNYDFIGYQNVHYLCPHGLSYVNETFFYATSWPNNTVFAHSSAGNATSWTENLFIDAWPLTGSSGGDHISADDCGRYWLSLRSYGIKIFDSQRSFHGTFNPAGSSVFDTIIGENYLIYLSDSSSNRIIRIDPDIRC